MRTTSQRGRWQKAGDCESPIKRRYYPRETPVNCPKERAPPFNRDQVALNRGDEKLQKGKSTI